MIAELGIAMRLLSDEELAASRAAILAGADLSDGVWLFGYGSLIWNPAFHFTERLTGTVHGYHRRFCLWTHLGAVARSGPGWCSGSSAGACRGAVFHIAREAVEEELAIVWRREMLSGAYVPRWVQALPVLAAIAPSFVINRAHERYARFLPDDRIAEVIATAEGWLGPCADYLINTVDHLAALGVHDRPLERLRAQVLARRHADEGRSA